ncbi:uncharacterized protein HMPREF1541_08637 [Cyphellophora europaea CBS 101466]|uniref:Uncharacterized protein n=1 Tax=Cyphellophora europaea (strain CBS 101466) TaxID=1220924 RepID=W2RJ57_CYPE1|nr:uncharacterized protein HMPREF1541_08637 [Cyphellophora europaea CBS 101466]ETN36360.1 hypothetical protein HMPREF1541_08637 [Cyphellophora europaea CBS 101466]
MPVEIPGFVYDAARGRYFRVQENHQNTQHVALRSVPGSGNRGESAGQPSGERHAGSLPVDGGRSRGGVGARYTREVVEGQKRIWAGEGRKKRRRKDKGSSQPLSQPQTTPSQGGVEGGRQSAPHRRGSAKHAPDRQRHSTRRLSSELELQLRFRHRAAITTGTSVESLIKQRYAATLEPRKGTASAGMVGTSGVFVVDPVSKELFTSAQLGRGRGEEFCVTPYSDAATSPDEERENHGPIAAAATTDDEEEAAPAAAAHYNRANTIPIFDSAPLIAAATVADGCVVWVTRSPHDPTNQLQHNIAGVPGASSDPIHTSTRYGGGGGGDGPLGGMPPLPWARWRDDFGDWGTQTMEQIDTHVWDVAGSPARDGTVVWASSRGVVVRSLGGAGDGAYPGDVVTRRVGEAREAMCVGWKDENVWVTGDRDGRVGMGDVRVQLKGEGVVGRLRHGSGAVSRVQGMGSRCPWGVLVWGITGAAVYDLRWTKDVPIESTSFERNGSRQGRKKRPKWATQPLFDFDIPESRMQRQYGMGFAFDAEMGAVAAAWPGMLRSSHVGLWDVSTGKMLPGGLEERVFEDSVACMQFVDLEGRGEGVKSLLLSTKGRIEAWEV